MQHCVAVVHTNQWRHQEFSFGGYSQGHPRKSDEAVLSWWSELNRLWLPVVNLMPCCRPLYQTLWCIHIWRGQTSHAWHHWSKFRWDLPDGCQLCGWRSTFDGRPKSTSTSTSTPGGRSIKARVTCVQAQDEGSEPWLKTGGKSSLRQWGSRWSSKQFCLPRLHRIKQVQFALWSDTPYWACLLHHRPP